MLPHCALCTCANVQDFTCHCWLPDERVAIGSVTGEIVLLEGMEVRYNLPVCGHMCTMMSNSWLVEANIATRPEPDTLVLLTFHAGHTSVDAQYKATLQGASGTDLSINCLLAYSKGFIAGGAGGTLQVFERSDEVPELYRYLKVRHVICAM